VQWGIGAPRFAAPQGSRALSWILGTLLDISARTAQNHIAHIYDKIGTYSRTGAALFAVENALLLPD